MFLSNEDQTRLLRVVEYLHHSLDGKEIREKTGELILDLLQADHYASFVWSDEKQSFQSEVFLNMDPSNIDAYKNYYCQVDPITEKLKERKEATAVSQILAINELVKTEFYNDFLATDGLHYGANLHVHNEGKHIGDIRVWRGKHRPDFDARDIYLLNLIEPHFRCAMHNANMHKLMESTMTLNNEAQSTIIMQPDPENLRTLFGLTLRETQVVQEVLTGKKDEEIANDLCIAFSTLRTHLKNIFQKLDVPNRTSLQAKIMSLNV